MKRLFILSFLLFCLAEAIAQPANDLCMNATIVTPGSCIDGTTVGAVDDWAGAIGCQGPPTSNQNHPDVWYSFVANNTFAQFIITPSGSWSGSIELVLARGTCAAGFTVIGNQCDAPILNTTFTGLQVGTIYYFTVSNEFGGTPGPFKLCLSPLPSPGQDCMDAAILCNSSPFTQSTSKEGFGNILDVNSANSCWAGGGESQSKWFKFTASKSGTLEFNISPIDPDDDYDWAIWNITSDPMGCTTKGNSIACNWSGCPGSTGLSSCISNEPGVRNCGKPPGNADPCFGGGLNPRAWGNWAWPGTSSNCLTSVLNIVAGNTYALLVDNYSSTNSGFTLTFGGACGGGTAKIGPDANFTYSPGTCGTYNFTAANANSNSSYLWEFGDGQTANTPNATHPYSSPGTYTVTLKVTDPLGCTVTSSTDIIVNSALSPTINCGTSTTSSVTFNWTAVSGATGYSISYQINAGAVNNIGAIGNVLSYPVTGLSPGDNVTITVTPTGSGCFSSSTKTCTATACTPPTASISYATPFCVNDATAKTVTLNGTGTYTGGTYTAPANLTINSTTGAITPSTSIAGTYTVTYTIAASGGCPAVIATTSVTIDPVLTPTINCGTSTTSSVNFTWAAVSGATGYSISYQINAGAVNNIGAIGNVLTYPVTGLAAGDNVTITVTPTGSGCFNSSTKTCSATACTPPTASISYATPFCVNDATAKTVSLTGTGTFTGGTYTAPANLTINSTTGTITPSTSIAGTYTVTYTIAASGGCPAVIATTSVTIDPVLTPTINCGTSTTSSVNFTWAAVSGATGYNVSYNINGGAANNIGAIGNVLSYPVTGLAPGDNVTITVTPTGSGCFNSSTKTCTATACTPPTASISYATPFCVNDATAKTVSLTGTGTFTGGTYTAPANLTINSATGDITPSTSIAGTYTVTYTIAASGGCPAVIATTSVTIDPVLTPTINCGTSTTSSVNFTWATVSGATGYNVSYNINGGAVNNIGAIGNVLTYPVTGLAPGDNVTITVTPTGSGCFNSSTKTCTATACTPPTASISYATPFCVNDATAKTVSLTGTGTFTGGTYTAPANLTINSTTGDITPSTSLAGTYTVTYTIAASGGCPAVIATTSVTIDPVLTPTINCGTSTTSSVNFTWAAVSGATGYNVSYNINGGAVNNIGAIGNVLTYPVTGLAPGDNVTITVTPTGSGCFNSSIKTCTATACTPPTASISYATPFCVNDATAKTVSLTGTGTFTGGTYTAPANLTINSSTGDITPSTSIAGTYTVTYTIAASGGCPAVIATTSVTIDPVLTATINCGTSTTSSVNFTWAAVSGATGYNVSYNINGGAVNNIGAIGNVLTYPVTGLAPGDNVTITVTPTGSGCFNSSTKTCTATACTPPTASISYATPFCVNDATAKTVSLTGTGTFTGGTYTAPANLTINSTTGDITPSTSIAGTYTVTYTIAASGGCPAVIATTSVTIDPVLTPTINCGTSTTSSVNFTWATVSGATGYNVSYNINGGAVNNIGAIGNVLTYPVTGLAPGDNVTITVTPTGTGCFNSSTKTCTATACTPPTASISYATPFCVNDATAKTVTLNGTGVFTGGTYSAPAGLTVNSSTGDITPSTSLAGTYTVTYTIAASGGCPAVIATTSVTIDPVLTATINCGTSTTSSVNFTWAAVSGATGYNVSYNINGGAVNNIGAIGNVLSYPVTGLAAADNVTITVTPTGSGCFNSSIKTCTATACTPPTASISYATPFCVNDATAKTVSLTGTGTFTGGTYTSTFGLSLNSTTGNITPSTSIAGTYTVTYTIAASGSCPAVTATTSVTIDPVLTPTINCGTSTTSSVNFTWAAVSGATGYNVSYNINGGAVNNIGAIGNVLTYQVTGLAAADNVTITVTPTGSGCFNSSTKTCTATACTPPTASISYATPFCVNDATAKTVSLTGTGTFTGGTYTSTFGLSLNSTTGNITPSTSIAGTYTVTYTIAASGSCPAVTATTSVTINPVITPTFNPVAAICSGGTLSALPTTSTNGINGAWSPALNNTATTTYTFTPSAGQCATTTTMAIRIKQPSISTNNQIICSNQLPYTWNGQTYNASGTYTKTLVSASGCDSVATLILTVINQPNLVINDPPIFCETSSVDLSNGSITTGSQAGLTYTYWSDAAATVPLTNTSVNIAGTYYIKASTTTGGCSVIKPVVVTTEKQVPGIRYSDELAQANTSIQLQARSIGINDKYNWSPSIGLDLSGISNPNFLYDKNMEYLITITSQAGCITKDTQLVVVNTPAQIIGSGIFVPKAWTPNGDGHNDLLIPFTVNITSIKYFRIYNRWGQLVFSANGMSRGWNGIFKGIAQPIEVYTWIIEATGVDGKNYKSSGNSVLIR